MENHLHCFLCLILNQKSVCQTKKLSHQAVIAEGVAGVPRRIGEFCPESVPVSEHYFHISPRNLGVKGREFRIMKERDLLDELQYTRIFQCLFLEMVQAKLPIHKDSGYTVRDTMVRILPGGDPSL